MKTVFVRSKTADSALKSGTELTGDPIDHCLRLSDEQPGFLG